MEHAPGRDWTGAVLAAALVLTPLALAPHVLVGYDVTPKSAVILVAAAAVLLCLPQWWGGLRHAWIPALLFGIELASAAASTALSARPDLSLAGTVWRRYGLVNQAANLVLAAAAAAYVRVRPERAARLAAAVVIAGAAVSVYAVMQALGFDPILPAAWYTTQFLDPMRRPPATLGHAMYLSIFLAAAVFLAAGLALRAGRLRRWYAAAALAALLGVAIGASRAAALGVVAGAAMFAATTRGAVSRRDAIRAAIGLGIVAAAFAALLVSPPGGQLRMRLYQWVQDARGGPRPMVWRDSLRIFAAHWTVGAGPETFAGEFERVESADLARAYPEHYHEAPHNLLLEAAVSRGVPGIAATLALAVFGLWSAARAGRDRELRAGIAAALSAMLVAFQFSNVTLATGLLYFMLIALAASGEPSIRSEVRCLAAAARLQSRDRPGAVRDRYTAEPRLFAARPVWRWIAAVPAAGFFACAVLYVVHDASFAGALRAASAGDLRTARAAFDRAASLPFPKPGWELQLSRRLAASRQWDLARAAAARAERNAEDPFNAVYQSAVLAASAGDLAGAERKATETVRLAPNWYKPRMLRAAVRIAAGRADEARQDAARARDLAGSNAPEVRRMLNLAGRR